MNSYELLKRAVVHLEGGEHYQGCRAIHGPEHETWIVEKDCDCKLSDDRELAKEIKQYLELSEGSSI